jgi:undecaprenyl-phosphate 4-deoxy-4-formamido-L-arabinose transferase
LTETFEVILVNDGSTDDTFMSISELAGRYPWVIGVDLMRNYGQHNALLCGVRLAKGEFIVTIDDDLQNPPEEIPKLIAKLGEGFDVVYGTPVSQQHGFWRVAASRITRLALQQVLGAETAKNVSAFRVVRSRVRDAFAGYGSSFVSIDVLLTWGTSRFAAVPVRHDPRQAGASHYTFRKLLVHSLNMVTGFSTVPLQLASMMGFSATAFGLLVLVYVVGRYVVGGSAVPGFPFLASIIAIFSGIQLFAIGVIGEYLARMHFRMLERPTYTVRAYVTRDAKEV